MVEAFQRKQARSRKQAVAGCRKTYSETMQIPAEYNRKENALSEGWSRWRTDHVPSTHRLRLWIHVRMKRTPNYATYLPASCGVDDVRFSESSGEREGRTLVAPPPTDKLLSQACSDLILKNGRGHFYASWYATSLQKLPAQRKLPSFKIYPRLASSADLNYEERR